MQLRHILALFLAACQPATPTATGFGSAPGVTTAAASTGMGSTGSSDSGTTGEESSSGHGDADPAEPARDLGGMPDFGDGTPVGCQGKIDFLFAISRHSNMQYLQAQLAAAFPQFIDTIESKFADFDYHIMVVTGDDGWGNDACTEVCPDLECKIGEPCCPLQAQNGDVGMPCCPAPDYPCQQLDLVTACDRRMGAGEVFPAGIDGEPNKPCPIDGSRRYLVKGQSDLEQTFACIASVGGSGWYALGEAMVAALQDGDPTKNKLGSCNPGFLRDDALLMVTLMSSGFDGEFGSAGTPIEWAEAVIDAKHGDDRSVVMLNFGGNPDADCEKNDRLCQVTKLFPFHHLEFLLVADYGPAFLAATSLVETACAGFVPAG